jgi:hypothetical protein
MNSRAKDLVRLFAATITTAAPAAVSVVNPVVGAVLAIAQPAAMVVAEYGINRVSEVASVESGLTGLQIAEKLAESESGIRLLVRTTEVARTAVLDEKLQALGRCLAAGVQDDPVIDVEVILVGVIAALETYHLRVLSIMSQPRTYTGRDSRSMVLESETDELKVVDYWFIGNFEAVNPTLTPDIVESLIGPMLAQGVIVSETTTSGGLGAYMITALGRRLLERING